MPVKVVVVLRVPALAPEIATVLLPSVSTRALVPAPPASVPPKLATPAPSV